MLVFYPPYLLGGLRFNCPAINAQAQTQRQKARFRQLLPGSMLLLRMLLNLFTFERNTERSWQSMALECLVAITSSRHIIPLYQPDCSIWLYRVSEQHDGGWTGGCTNMWSDNVACEFEGET